MLLKILGGFDLISGAILIFGSSFDWPWKFLWVIGILLILKACFGMLKDFASWIDLLSGVVFLALIIISIPKFIAIILGVLLIQKAIMSFL